MRRLLQVRATDADTGLNSRLTYSLLANDTAAASHFHVDACTGWLSVVRPLDFETHQVHELSVRVSDDSESKSTSLSTLCRVITVINYCWINKHHSNPNVIFHWQIRISVTDVNDNRASLRVLKYLNESRGHMLHFVTNEQVTESIIIESNWRTNLISTSNSWTSSILNPIQRLSTCTNEVA